MSITNPNKVITEERLGQFYQEILPYLGGAAETGFTPVGTIIAVMGNNAPANYLACNGQIIYIADYPELANYFENQFGSKNYFGGDGTTTFGIPDLRGEFLRGTGNNSHENCGNGANVGVHQNGTIVTNMYTGTSNGLPITYGKGAGLLNSDKGIGAQGTTYYYIDGSQAKSGTVTSAYAQSAVRPTNTSVLYCIATKDIFMNPSSDYSTNEAQIGTWINGKPLYQRTFVYTTPTTGNAAVDIGTVPNVEIGWIEKAFYKNTNSNFALPGAYMDLYCTGRNTTDVTYTSYAEFRPANASTGPGAIRAYFGSTTGSNGIYVTVRYTKTTD